MTLHECYRAFGGDLQEVLLRLPSERLILKLLRKFPEDPSMAQLAAAIPAGDHETAFRCAHNMKGLCLNLGFPALLESSCALTEALRPGTPFREDTVSSLLEKTREDYETVCNAIAQLEI